MALSALRPLRGGCQCGRNRYIIAMPQDGVNEAQVHFNTEPHHQIPLATPLAAYIRVPLEWYHSTTYAFFPDETHTLIRRVYTHPSQQHAKRHFCGYCGTPLSYWSEKPHSEADYINLTLGSLLREDLRDLEDMGLVPEAGDEGDGGDNDEKGEKGEKNDKEDKDQGRQPSTAALRQSYGVPWFDGMVEGTRLGSLRRSQGVERLQDGRVKVEWEIVEFSSGGNDTPAAAAAVGADQDVEMDDVAQRGKRKLEERDDTEAAAGAGK